MANKRFKSTGAEGKQLCQDVINGLFGNGPKPNYMRVYNMPNRPYQQYTKDAFRFHARNMIHQHQTGIEHQAAIGKLPDVYSILLCMCAYGLTNDYCVCRYFF